MLKHLHTLSDPAISVYSQVSEEDVKLYFFKGVVSDPDPETAMAVIEVASEDNLLVAKIFDEEDVCTPDTSTMHTLVMDVETWGVEQEK